MLSPFMAISETAIKGLKAYLFKYWSNAFDSRKALNLNIIGG